MWLPERFSHLKNLTRERKKEKQKFLYAYYKHIDMYKQCSTTRSYIVHSVKKKQIKKNLFIFNVCMCMYVQKKKKIREKVGGRNKNENEKKERLL